jgi:hypothetical protein
MGILSLIFFICSLIVSYNGFLLIFGLKYDIEGGAYFFALLFGLPLFVAGVVVGVIGLIYANKMRAKNKKPNLLINQGAKIGIYLNGFGILFWVIHLLNANLK